MKRKEKETFDAYKKRRKTDKMVTAIKLIPKLVWNSYGIDEDGNIVGRTFVRGRDELTNSRADSNRIEARKRKLEKRTKSKELPSNDHPDTELWQQPLPFGSTDG